ncbi:Ring/U-Box superfamily protein [Euphorbia peplus]|nr:Ring/U-Box superfamily protein [Euphorbia peplus]
MAVAGLHNVSVLDSSFRRESPSEVVTRRDDGGRGNTRASPLLQMWRELEDEHVVSHARGRIGGRVIQNRVDVSSDVSRVEASDSPRSERSCISEDLSVSENDYGQWSRGPVGSESGQEDSSDMGDNERERVRQIFREWTNCAARERSSSVSRRSARPRGEWLGENEQERVRVIREWVQLNSRPRSTSRQRREERGTEIVGQIEQVLDGSAVNNHNEGQIENTRRGFRRLCGRQALIDMLKKAERERQQELQGLLEHRAVSQFAHRNRIQSLLRGWFLRNDRRVDNKRPTSTAASELGLLRERHTVSDLREGFFSRLDSTCSQASSCISDTSSNSDANGSESIQIQTNNLQPVADEFLEQTESNVGESESHGLSDSRTDVRSGIVEDRSFQEPASGSQGDSGQVSENEIRGMQESANVEFIQSRDITGEHVNVNRRRSINANEAGEPSLLPSTCEINPHLPEPNEGSSASVVSSHVVELESDAVVNVDRHQTSTQVEEWQNRVVGSDNISLVEGGLGTNDWRDDSQDNAVHQHEAIANEWLENEERETWHEDSGFQEAVQSWLEEPAEQNAVPAPRMDPFYLPDDDNVYNGEIRELLNRRSVSTLLRSGFRESLDQLVRSYVERQSQGPLDWELQGSSPTHASAEQELEQQNEVQNEGHVNPVQRSQDGLSSSSMPPVQQFWDQESQHFPWPQHDVQPRFGIEWDIINDMRIDMARLQQRMSNMQRMLEACMDMQLELQRSIRQEVSAALNRSGGSAGMSEAETDVAEDKSKWDCVRKGVCCLCCDSNIDSLLYRCGHMCTCSNCANKLVQKGEKCPMCRAPVIEVIRAYSIL